MGSYFSRRSEQKTIIVSPAVTTLKSVDPVVSESTGTVEYVAPVVSGETGTVEHVAPVVMGETGTVEHVEPAVMGETGTVEHVEPVVSGLTGTVEETVETITKEEIIHAFINPLTKLVDVPAESSDENVVSAKRHKKYHTKK